MGQPHTRGRLYTDRQNDLWKFVTTLVWRSPDTHVQIQHRPYARTRARWYQCPLFFFNRYTWLVYYWDKMRQLNNQFLETNYPTLTSWRTNAGSGHPALTNFIWDGGHKSRGLSACPLFFPSSYKPIASSEYAGPYIDLHAWNLSLFFHYLLCVIFLGRMYGQTPDWKIGFDTDAEVFYASV